MSTPVAVLFATVTVALVGYALGSIPVALWVARRNGVDDLRAVGDHNPGYWNAMGQLGHRAARPVFVGDVAKGALAALLGRWLGDTEQWWLAYVGGGAAMVGHAYPIFAGFRGGRSVLSFVGAAAVCAPFAALAAACSMVAVWIATRRFDRAARVGVFAFPVWQLALEGPSRTAATGALMTFVGLRFALAARAGRAGRTSAGRAGRARRPT